MSVVYGELPPCPDESYPDGDMNSGEELLKKLRERVYPLKEGQESKFQLPSARINKKLEELHELEEPGEPSIGYSSYIVWIILIIFIIIIIFNSSPTKNRVQKKNI